MTLNVTPMRPLNQSGGGPADTLSDSGAHLRSMDAEAGSDTLQGTQIVDVTLTGSGANGYAGGVAERTSVAGGKGGGKVLHGSVTRTGENAVSPWAVGWSTYYDGGAGRGALTLSAFG